MLFQNNLLKRISIGILFVEEIKDNKIIKIPTITQFGDLSNFNADTIIDAKNIKIKMLNEFSAKIK